MSKKLLEKKKLREEEEAAAHVFQEFISVFQSPASEVPNKMFIKSATLAAGATKQLDPQQTQIYQPPKPFKIASASVEKAIECARICKPEKFTTKRPKRKSNLELFKEELKSLHQKKIIENTPPSVHEFNEPTTTNLFITKSTLFSREDLINKFGPFGPLASVKIMWPKNNEHVAMAAHCGFVAFMARKDAERAFKHHQQSTEFKVCWAKPIDIPQQPIHIPNALLDRFLPPPATNLPFNAQPTDEWIKTHLESDRLSKTVVKVVIPLNKRTLWTINRMVEFVVREGHLFEAIIMHKESNNPEYRFLFDNKSPEHVYYRWRLFSVLNGDDLHCWRMKPFRMFTNGSIWKPPETINFKSGMPDDLIAPKTTSEHFTHAKYKTLVKILRELTTSRWQIAKAMTFCIDNLNSLVEIIDLVLDSLKNPQTTPIKKLARLFLLSDVLYNIKSFNFPIDFFELVYKDDLTLIFASLSESLHIFTCNSDKHNFELRITKILRQWHISNLVSDDFIKTLEERFTKSSRLQVPSKWDSD